MGPEQNTDTVEKGFPPGLVAYPTFLLSKLGVHAKAATCEALNEAENMSPGHLGIMFFLSEYGPAAQRELARSLRYDASDVVALVDELERRGWAERKVDSADRRRYAVTLTKAGEAAQGRLKKMLDETNHTFMDSLDDSERKQLASLLHRLLAAHDTRVTG